ncbi:MAG TPA: PilZ domain-containing protein, partial [Gemmataceae bacterium]|nr:PilZ domain-containing protein [Gemmataceae bacterium]
VKYVFGFNYRDKEREEAVIARLNALRYPTLAHLEVQEQAPGRLAVVMDDIDGSLWGRFQESQAQGLCGIPRAELLGHLRVAAETLDHLYEQHAIQHLALNPRDLLLDGNRLLIGGFGLAQLLYLRTGQSLPQAQKSYAAPELLRNGPGRASDQYSLALIYVDLLCGTSARRPTSAHGMAPARHTAPRDVGQLAPADREIVQRALSEDPQKRWPNCTEFIKALQDAAPGILHARHNTNGEATAPRRDSPAPADPTAAGESLSTGSVINSLLASTSSQEATQAPARAPELLAPGEILLRKFSAPLPVGTARLKIEEFGQQCGARVVSADDETIVLQITRPRSLWQQCIGRQPGLELRVHLARPRNAAATPIDVSVQISPLDCGRKRGAQLLEEVGPLLLESLRTALQVNAERRMQERVLWQQTLPIRPVLPDGTLGEMHECQGKDISANGIGFYVPHPLPSTLISIDVPTNTDPPSVTVHANIVRVQRCGNGWYEVGALFVKNGNE